MRAGELEVLGGLILIILVLGVKYVPELWRGVSQGFYYFWNGPGNNGRFWF